jgi:hypothetical protein
MEIFSLRYAFTFMSEACIEGTVSEMFRRKAHSFAVLHMDVS